MHDMLQKILVEKKKQLQYTNKKFREALLKSGLAVIGEIKLASPSNSTIGSVNDIEAKIKAYEIAGVDALSIITEKNFFKGGISFITKAKHVTSLPILQKDFVISEYQIYEARFLGSDAVLLIARMVSKKILQQFVALAQSLGVEPVVEIANKRDMDKAVSTKTKIIAVNARDLDTFEIHVEKAARLMRQLPKRYITLGFSGIISAKEVDIYKKAGAKGVLIGTSLMKSNKESEFLRSLKI